MKVLAVVGSREFPDIPMVEKWMLQYAPQFDKFVSGGADGVDTAALTTWKEIHGLNKNSFKVYPARWDRYGMGAGFVRNVQIIRDATFVACFWTAQTNGTLDDLGLLFNCGTPFNLYVR